MVTKFINYKKNLCVIQLYFWHNRMKNLLLKSKPKTPADIVRQARDHLKTLNQCCPDTPKTNKQQQKITELIGNLMLELKSILYGRTDREPVPQDCAELTQEFFKDNTLRLLIMSLSKLNPETRTDATHAVVNLLRQKVNSRMIACDYLEANLDLIDILVSGYDKNKEIEALHYGDMLRECIRHQSITKYLLESNPTMKLFFDYIQVPDFEIAADAAKTFKQLLTRHKSTVAEFLSKNYDWFFADYESKLLESTNYVTRRQAVKLLGEMLMHRSNSYVMTRFVSSKDNLRVLMNLLKEPSKSIKVDAFQVFKLFVANQNKPACIVNILVANRSKLLRLIIGDLQMDTEDEEFEADKALVVKEIAALETIVSP